MSLDGSDVARIQILEQENKSILLFRDVENQQWLNAVRRRNFYESIGISIYEVKIKLHLTCCMDYDGYLNPRQKDRVIEM